MMTTLISAFLLTFFGFVYGVLLGMGLIIRHITKTAKDRQVVRISGKCYVLYEKHDCDDCTKTKVR